MFAIVKKIFILFVFLYLSGCAIGRSWDSPSVDESNEFHEKEQQIHIYVDGSSDLVKRLFGSKAYYSGSKFIVVDGMKNKNIAKYPFLSIEAEKPKWSDNAISYSSYVSVFTFSVVPGYTSKSSKIILKLSYRDRNGNLIVRQKSYIATRHYISWLPLVLFSNFGSDMANSWGTLNSYSYWEKANAHFVRKFLLENIGVLKSNGYK